MFRTLPKPPSEQRPYRHPRHWQAKEEVRVGEKPHDNPCDEHHRRWDPLDHLSVKFALNP